MILVMFLLLHAISCGRNHSEANEMSRLIDYYTTIRQVFGCDVDLCSDRAVDDNPPPVTLGTCCSRCSCASSCERNGECCPDMLQTFPEPHQYPTGGVYGCVSRLHKHSDNSIYDRVVSKCDEKYLDANTTRRCAFAQDYNETYNKEIDSYVPVVDKQTNETYRNYFCAKCNFVLDDTIVQWNVAIQCIDGVAFLPRGVSTLIDDIAKVDDCDVIYSPPIGFPDPERCTMLISSCNETGNWLSYDKLTEDACAAFRAPFSYTYANVFCYMCNTDGIVIRVMECLEPSGGGTWLPTFSMLLDFRKSPKKADSESRCSDGFEYDYHTEECRDVVCLDMTVYDNGTCRSLFNKTQPGICYEMFIMITPKSHTMLPSKVDFITALIELARDLLNQENTVSYYDIHTPVIDDNANATNEVDDTYYILHVEIRGKEARELTTDILQLDNTEAEVRVSGFYETVSVQLQITSFEVLREFNNDTHVLFQSWVNSTGVFPTITNALLDAQSTGILPVDCATSRVLVTQVSSCPLVSLNLSDIVFEKRRTGIYLVDIDLLFRLGTFKLDTTLGKLAVCASSYIQSIKAKYEGVNILNETDDVSELMMLVCSILSVTCLVIVLVTYCLFPVLRTQPGVNNTALSVCLLLAQTGFIIGTKRPELGSMCSVIGGTIHFLFLAGMFWMGVCSVHMFRVFRSLTSPKEIGPVLKTTTIYAAVVIVLSVVCVAVNITVTYIRSSGSDYGYGGDGSNCYITSAVMIGYTMTLPAGLVVAFNVILFLCVVVRINNMSAVQCSTIKTRRYFAIYVRLSTITGVAWLSCIPFFVTNMLVFKYISVILTSSQGVFIFMAFIVNKRVWNLYKGIVGMRAAVVTSSSETRIARITDTKT